MAKEKKNLLTFRQDDRFYYQRAMRLIENMEIVRGIKMLNVAIQHKPKNIEYRMSLCDVLSDIGYYSKSIDEIIEIMVIGDDIDPKCYYMLGYNYYELGEYIKALNMFERYLSINPEGELSDDVYFFLENIEDFTVSSWQDYSMFPSHIYSTKSNITNIDETRISEDIEIWSREQNIKALMAYSKKEYDEAAKICRNILSRLPRQSSVQCTLALALNRTGETDESIEIANTLAKDVPNDAEELFKVSFVLCELRMHKKANETLKRLKAIMPYSEKINHYLAISYYNTGNFDEAQKLWNTCLEISGDMFKYSWYIENISKVYHKELKYSDFLPKEAIIENIAYLEKRVDECELMGDNLCWSDEKFKRIILGSFEKCNEDVQKKLAQIIYEYADADREGIFRKLLLSDDVGEKIKNEILSFLHHMNAKEPFLMMTDYQLVDVAINVISVDNKSKSDFIKALNYAINKMCKDKLEKDLLIALWTSVAIKFMAEDKRLKKHELWAAAFYFEAVKDLYSEEELIAEAKEHGVSKKSLLVITKLIREKKEEKNDN